MDRIKRIVVSVAFVAFAAGCLWDSPLLYGRPQERAGFSLSDWKTREYPGVRYLGDDTCAECHALQAEPFAKSAMANALETAAESEILRKNPRLTFRNGSYTYEIVRKGSQSIYTVGDGVRSISAPILYAFGHGIVGQTYLFQHDGKFYETRVSYYRAPHGLDVTIGQSREAPTSVEDALGRVVPEDEARSCFGCHAPEAVKGSQLQLEKLDPGLTCESCHGPGERHVAAVKAGAEETQIFNPGGLNALELSQEFCGSCHLGFDQTMMLPERGGVNNIRFQAYRIFKSPGHRGADARTSCIACHDPHEKLEHKAASYDAKCFACHLSDAKETKTEARKAAPCPVGRKECVTCHMPKVELPGVHAKFADHWIRIAKPGDPVPH